MKEMKKIYLLIAALGTMTLVAAYITGGIFFYSEDRQVTYDLLLGNINVEQTAAGFFVTQGDNRSKIIRKKSIRIEGKGRATKNNIVVNGIEKSNYSIDIILDDVKIQGKEDDFCAFDVTGLARIVLHHEGENCLKSGKYYAGLQIGENAYLEFAGDKTSKKNIPILTSGEKDKTLSEAKSLQPQIESIVYADKSGFYTSEKYDDKEQLQYIKSLKIPELSSGFNVNKKEQMLEELRKESIARKNTDTIFEAKNQGHLSQSDITIFEKSDDITKNKVNEENDGYIAISDDKLQIVINSLTSSLIISLAKESKTTKMGISSDKTLEETLFLRQMELDQKLRNHISFEEYLNTVFTDNENGCVIEEIITRAVLVTVLYEFTSDRGKVKKSKLKDSFLDVDKDAWYGESTAWAKENGLITGVTKDQFEPNKGVTREQMAVILAKYLKLIGKAEDADGRELPFKDRNQIRDWSKKSVALMVKYNIMGGDGENYFYPKSYVAREEFRNVLVKLSEL